MNLEKAVRIRDLTVGSSVDLFAVVREAEVRESRDGGSVRLILQLGDRTGRVQAKSWDNVTYLAQLCQPGTPVQVQGPFEGNEKYGDEINVKMLRAAEEGEFDWADLIEVPETPVEELEAYLDDLIVSVRADDLKALLYKVLGPTGTPRRELFMMAPAARTHHHAYRHGLLEHSLLVAQSVEVVSRVVYGQVDRDVALTGALLHDVGKVQAYTPGPFEIDLTDLGKLYGEIPLGFERVRKAIEQIEGFDPERARGVLHIVLSHHGSLQHGSPVTPRTREAILVHYCDQIGARLGMMDRLEKAKPPDDRWSDYDRALAGEMYFGKTKEEETDAEPQRPADEGGS